jgi:hypothetical protein
MLQPGDPAPTPTLQTLAGEPFPLAKAWRGQNGLFIFLRHLG